MRRFVSVSLWRTGVPVFVAAAVALLGTAIVHGSNAASPAVTAEPEAGTIAAPAGVAPDAAASGGKAVKFGAASAPSGAVLFEDDFSGPAGAKPDSTKWGEYSTCGYNSSAAYGNIKCGMDETLDGNGHLIIPATPARGQSIMTGDKFRFLYGTMSAWIKMPPQVGYWPAFWSLNNNTSGANANPVGEVDVAEAYTTWPTIYHALLHSWDSDSTKTSGGGPDWHDTGIDLSAGYHKYSAKIEPNKITFYFDDKQVGDPAVPKPDKTWAFGPAVTRGNWLILTLAIGGAGGQQQPATENAQMLVDRVEVTAN